MARFVLIILFVIQVSTAIAETKTAIKPSELNQKILNDIQTNYTGYKVIEAFKVNNRGIITYEAIIQKDNDKLYLYYTLDGVFLRKQQPRTSMGITKKLTLKSIGKIDILSLYLCG